MEITNKVKYDIEDEDSHFRVLSQPLTSGDILLSHRLLPFEIKLSLSQAEALVGEISESIAWDTAHSRFNPFVPRPNNPINEKGGKK